MSRDKQIKGDKGRRGMVAFCPRCGRTSKEIAYDHEKDICSCKCGWTNEESNDMQKQIEEMARLLCSEKENTCRDCDACNMCEFWVEASTLYNAGYRKQGEGVWLVKVWLISNCKTLSCSCCGYKEERGPAWNISWGVPPFCPNCGAKMKGAEQ